MREISESKNLRYGVILSYVVMFISLLGTLFITNKIMIYVGDYDYGLYSFTNSITSWLTIVSSALTASYLRFATIESKNNNLCKVNTIYLIMLGIIGLLTLVIGLSIVLILLKFEVCVGTYNWLDSKKIYLLTITSIVNISLTMPFSVHALYINYNKKFVFSKMLQILTIVLNYVGHFVIAFTTKNVLYISYFTIFITVLTFIFNYIYSRKALNINFVKITLKNNKALFNSIVVFSSIIIFNTVVDQINTTVDKILLGFFSTPENVTVYQLAQQFNVYLVSMSVSICSIYAPTIHKLISDDDKEKLNNLFLNISHGQIIVLCFIAFGFLSCGKYFISWWIGDSRITAYYVAAVLLLIDICPLSINASIEIQRAKNKHLFRALLYFFVAIFNVLVSILFIFLFDKKYAIYACLLGSVIARILSHWLIMNFYNYKYMKLPVIRYLLILFKYLIFSFLVVILANLLFNHFIMNNISNNVFLFFINGLIYTILFSLMLFLINYKKCMLYLNNKFFNSRRSI